MFVRRTIRLQSSFTCRSSFHSRLALACVTFFSLAARADDAAVMDSGSELTLATISEKPAVFIERLSPEEAAQRGRSSSVSEPVYIDQLIDPDTPAEDVSTLWYAQEDDDSVIFQSIQAATYYRDNSGGYGSSLDSGIEYIAMAPTHNFGELRLNLVAIDEDKDDIFYRGNGNDKNSQQQGLQRYSLEQIGLPINDRLSMDNILGTHRQSRGVPYSYRATVTNQRFSASEPDILGFTSRLYSATNGISLSTGRLGENYGAVMPGFVEQDGRVNRALVHHAAERYILSADVWKTSGRELDTENRTGSRLNWQALWGDSVETLTTIANSDDNVAALFSASQILSSGFSHDGGLYYFDPDFLWMDTLIGNDYAGAYYRFHHAYQTFYFSGSAEFRRDGIDGGDQPERDNTYANFNGNYRLDRDSQLGASYSIRESRGRDKGYTDRDYTEHTLRANYSHQFSGNLRNSIGTTLRTREDRDSQRVDYDVFYDLRDGSELQFSAEYNREDHDENGSNRYYFDSSWRTHFNHGGNFAVGAGYSMGDNRNSDEHTWNGYLNYDLLIGSHWAFAAQLDYNRAEYDLDHYDISDELFTDNEFLEDRHQENEQFSMLLSLTYAFGGRRESGILGVSGNSRGAGSIRGRLFLDANGDGIAQDSEKGLAGVTVYLDSVYPITTDARGEFEYPAVAPGEHHLFVDETRLPLPWSLGGTEYTPLQVQLRSTTRIDVPLRQVGN